MPPNLVAKRSVFKIKCELSGQGSKVIKKRKAKCVLWDKERMAAFLAVNIPLEPPYWVTSPIRKRPPP